MVVSLSSASSRGFTGSADSCTQHFPIIHIVLLTICNMKMYNGALADLNGRHHLSQHLEECFPAINFDHFFLSMLDVQWFKAH